MHIEMKRIGAIIRKARESKRLTQTALAEEVEVSLRTIIAIENEHRNPTLDVFYRLIQVLNIPPDLFFKDAAIDRSIEQEQFISEFLSCTECEQRIVTNTMRCLVRELRKDQ